MTDVKVRDHPREILETYHGKKIILIIYCILNPYLHLTSTIDTSKKIKSF